MLKDSLVQNENLIDNAIDSLSPLERKLLTDDKYKFLKGVDKSRLSYAAFSLNNTQTFFKASYLETREIVLFSFKVLSHCIK